jgi:Zn finger protein HypA/HybF involved in hydrogenase expression
MKAVPVFKEDIDKSLDEKVQRLISQKLAEREDQDKKKDVQSKIDAIKKTLIPRDTHSEIVQTVQPAQPTLHVHEHTIVENDCPTCKGHTLKVEGGTAKCSGPNCGKEYLLEEKKKKITSKSDRKDLLCTTCGHTMSERDIKGKNYDTCPLCEAGKGVMKINWDEIDSAKMISKGLIK